VKATGEGLGFELGKAEFTIIGSTGASRACSAAGRSAVVASMAALQCLQTRGPS
jgi:hypothetical protein